MSKPMHLSERVLQAVRGRLGVDDNESDASRDEQILKMPPRQIVKLYFGWVLGSEQWGNDAISVIEQAYGISLDGRDDV